MADQKEYLSKEKYNELEQELEHLQTKKRKEIAEQLEFAKSLGDLSENTEYQQAREDQAGVEDRISTIEALLKRAEIVSKKKSADVAVGSKVTVQKKGSQAKKEFQVVGSEEVDSGSGKISNRSPIGQSLMGKEAGESVNVRTPNGEITYKIVSVN